MVQSTYAQDSLILELQFEDNLLDNSSFNNDGLPLTTPIYVDGYCGKAIKIGRNVNDGVIVDGGVMNGLKDLTIAASVRLDDLSSNNNLLSCSNNFQANDFIIGYNDLTDATTDGWHIRVENQFYFFEGDNLVSDKAWHFFVLVKEGTSVSFYVDGIQHGLSVDIGDKTLNVDNDGFIIGQDQDCVAGCFDADQTWNGEIDDFKVYNKALLIDQIVFDVCPDCNGVNNGTSVIDICGECLEPTDPNFGQSCIDCNGVVEGTSVIDICGECLDPSDPIFNQSCIDCSGMLNGVFVLDDCGECLDPSDPTFNQSCIDCSGIPNGVFVLDDCGECLDPSDPTFNQSCIDCSGVLNGTFLIDECGNCLDSNDPEFSLD